MNIVKIIKNLKFLRVLMKKHLADENLQFQIRHDPKNVIDLDADLELSEKEKSENSDADKMIKAHEGLGSSIKDAQAEFANMELVDVTPGKNKIGAIAPCSDPEANDPGVFKTMANGNA